MWKVNEIRSSGLLRQFLAEGMALYREHCVTVDGDGDEDVDKMLTSSSAAALLESQSHSEAVKVCYLLCKYGMKVI